MQVMSAIFWVFGLMLSVTIAPQLRIWTWGPTMLCLSVATLAALPSYWRDRNSVTSTVLLISGSILVLWIGIRAATSPVVELAQADGLLTAMAVATFVSFRAIVNHTIARGIIIAGLCLTLLASIVVIGLQVVDPMYSPIFPNDEAKLPAGFFAHYSYGASFLIPASLLLLSSAAHGQRNWILKILLGTIAIGGCIAVFFTKSRGGFVGIGLGFTAFMILSILSVRHNKKAFTIMILAIPLIMLAVVAVFTTGLTEILQRRGGTGSIAEMFDNISRLNLINIAYSCIVLHPLFGGGSRSYSWECFQFWNPEGMGPGLLKPEHVHNEFIQTACDYGILGATLLLIFLVVVFISGIFSATAINSNEIASKPKYWNIGGLAGFLGLFAQSNFEGILRLPTGAIMLGLCLAAACFHQPNQVTKNYNGTLSRSVLTFFALLTASLLGKFGWQGTQATRTLWQSYFGKIPLGNEQRLNNLSVAIGHWPLASLYFERGKLHHSIVSKTNDPLIAKQYIELAILDYSISASKHPFDPESALNCAILLSYLERNDEAEEQFNRAVRNQGKMESAFRANHEFAIHLHNKGLREFRTGDLLASLNTLERAVKHVDQMAEIQTFSILGSADINLLVQVRESYGRVLESLEQYPEALKVYDETSTMRYGTSSHYRAGVLIGRRAVAAWSEKRTEDALALFIKALERTQAGTLPTGVTDANRAEYLEYLRKTIAYLQGARITPSANPQF